MATRTRRGGWPTGWVVTARRPEGARPLSLLDGVALDDLPLDSARTVVLVQDKDPVLLSGTVRDLFDVPASGAVSPEMALDAAQCADILDVLRQTLPAGESATR